MSDEPEQIEMAQQDDHKDNHSFAIGLLTGTAVGVALGMLFAPRAGSELRKQIRDQCSTGYQRARDTAGDWAHRCGEAFGNTREFLSHGAHDTQRYVHDVKDALTTKSPKRANGSPTAATAAPAAPARTSPAKTSPATTTESAATHRDRARAAVTEHSG